MRPLTGAVRHKTQVHSRRKKQAAILSILVETGEDDRLAQLKAIIAAIAKSKDG